MIRLTSKFLPLLLLLTCISAPPPPTFDAAKLAQIDTAIESAIAAGKTPGGVFRLERDGAVYQRAYGKRSLVPSIETMSEETIFDAASITKVAATTPAIFLLIERGKIQLDAPVKTYIPELAGDGRDIITIRHLLTHTSGLRPSLSLSDPWRGYEEGIALAVKEIPLNRPGFVFRYSDINFILLGEVVRRASGIPLNELVAREIYRPLKMVDSGFLPPSTKLSRIAPTEQSEEGMLRGVVHDPTSRRMGGVAGHAGLFTTASDLARYARMILEEGSLDGTRVFRPETIKLMTTVQTPADVVVRRAGGWDLDSNYSRPRGAYFPIGSFGHTGWTGGFLWIDPFSHTFFVFLSNRVHPDGKGSVIELQRTLGTLAAEAASVEANVPAALPRRAGGIGPSVSGGSVQNGIDELVNRRYEPLRGLRVGLITNHTGIDRYGNPTIDLLRSAPDVTLVALFSPEHGIRGEVNDKVGDTVDRRSGLPIYSLYGERRKPSPQQLEGLDALVFDIQDIGARFYTYVSTMGMAMDAAGEAGIRFFVLDRLNPINGREVEGPLLSGETSFTAHHPIVIRHGMTVGELAAMFKEEKSLPVDLTVIPLQGWSREQWQDQTGTLWINPSPNMRSLTAATLYTGVCLLERTNVSVGRGTPTPFELLGAPYIDGATLARELNDAGLPGVTFSPVVFTPDASVRKGERCEGVRSTLTDRDGFRALDTGIAIISTIHRLYPQEFTLAKVDELLRHPPTIEAIRRGESLEVIRESWRPGFDEFMRRRTKFLKY